MVLQWDRRDTYVADNVGEVFRLGYTSNNQVDLEISLAWVAEGDLELVGLS